MPEVISNSSPIQYLHQIEQLDLLPGFYGAVTVPEAVADELAKGTASEATSQVYGRRDSPLLISPVASAPGRQRATNM